MPLAPRHPPTYISHTGCPGRPTLTGPPAADPVSGVLFITSTSGCSLTQLAPAKERDNPRMTGTTISPWSHGGGQGGDGPAAPVGRGRGAAAASGGGGNPLAGIPGLFKGPVGRIVAIDMNTGEHLWMVPHGDTAQETHDAFRNNPLLKGVKVDSNWGRSGHAAMMATPTLLFASGMTADNRPHLFGIDKKSGKRLGARSEEHTSELQSQSNLVCRLLLEKKKKKKKNK